MAKTLDIVIANWNAGGLLRRCLDSIAASQGANSFLASVTLVDNASSDGSLDGLGDPALPLEVLRLDANIGYGRAANLSAGRGEADFVLFLNPDIALQPDTLGRSLESLQAKTAGGVGLLGVALLDEAGEVSRSCARFPTPWQQLGESLGLPRFLPGFSPPTIMTDWDHAESRRVDHVMGAYALMPRDLFDRLGGFDPAFFVYWEDLDLSLRARSMGAASYFDRTIEAYHKGGRHDAAPDGWQAAGPRAPRPAGLRPQALRTLGLCAGASGALAGGVSLPPGLGIGEALARAHQGRS